VKKPKTRNLVAKHMFEFNKPKVFKDKTKYQRKGKHKEAYENSFFHKPLFYLFLRCNLKHI